MLRPHKPQQQQNVLIVNAKYGVYPHGLLATYDVETTETTNNTTQTLENNETLWGPLRCVNKANNEYSCSCFQPTNIERSKARSRKTQDSPDNRSSE